MVKNFYFLITLFCMVSSLCYGMKKDQMSRLRFKPGKPLKKILFEGSNRSITSEAPWITDSSLKEIFYGDVSIDYKDTGREPDIMEQLDKLERLPVLVNHYEEHKAARKAMKTLHRVHFYPKTKLLEWKK